MRGLRRTIALACATLAGLFALTGEAVASTRPNIVLVQVDDMSRNLLNPVLGDGKRAMPNLKRLLAGEGANFTDYYTTTPTCSPSRSTLLSGQFGRNNGVVGNGGPFGGWQGWQGREILDRNLATMLQEAGYHTAHLGKFLNSYDRESVDPLAIPPGWNTWISDATEQSNSSYYGYYQLMRVERNGEPVDGGTEGIIRGPFGEPFYSAGQNIDPVGCQVDTPEVEGVGCNYHTDQMTRLAANEIREVDEPLFLQIDYHAPHADSIAPSGPQPATRHLGLARKVSPPWNPSMNEKNTSDKAFLAKRDNGFLRSRERRAIKTRYRTGLEAMRAVDEGIGHLIETLSETGKLEETYFIFVSDNGFFYGEHRFSRRKFLGYEPSARVPLLVRGPNIPGGDVSARVNTADLTPTILDAAGIEAAPDHVMDGRSLLPAARGAVPGGRRALLIERVSPTEMTGGTLPKIRPTPFDPNRLSGAAPNLPYRALLIGRFKYIKYTQGGEELYDLRRDPNELYSQARNPTHQRLLIYMRRMLQQYRDCSGAACLEPPAPTPKPGRFRLDARKPPKRFPPGVAYLYRDAVYVTVRCRSLRRCSERLEVHYQNKPVTQGVNISVGARSTRRARLPALGTASVTLQRASERTRRVELRQTTSTGPDRGITRISRPTLGQN